MIKKEKKRINLGFSHDLYCLYVRTLIGKLIKKGAKFKALKIYKEIRENIKLHTNKKKKVSLVFYIAMLNSMSKIGFKEIRMGSQKKQIPIPILEKKQILVNIATLLKISKNNKYLQRDKLIDTIVLSQENKGLLVRNKKLKYRKALLNKMLLNFQKHKKINKRIDIKKYVSQEDNFQIYKNKTPL